MPDKILQLQRPTYEECNDPLNLINILFAMWNPLLLLLNEQTPENTGGSCAGLDWLKAIKDNDISTIQIELNRIIQELNQ